MVVIGLSLVVVIVLKPEQVSGSLNAWRGCGCRHLVVRFTKGAPGIKGTLLVL